MTREEYDNIIYSGYLFACKEMKKESKTFDQFFNEMSEFNKEEFNKIFLEIKEAIKEVNENE